MKFLIFLCLLPCSAFADRWVPLAEEFANFTLTEPTTIRYGVGTQWTVVQRPAGTHECSYRVIADPALGNFAKKCERLMVDAAPTVGPGKLSDQDQLFIPSQDMLVSYCVGENDRCAPVKSVLKGLTYSCNNASFTDPYLFAVKHCWGAPMPLQPLTQYCWPTATDLIAGRWKLLFPDDSVTTYYDYFAVWTDSCSGKVVAQYGTPAEFAAVKDLWGKSNQELKTYQASQAVRQLTPSEIAYKVTALVTYSPHAEVKPSGTAADAPVYALNADGTRKTTAIAGKLALRGTACDMSKRIGATSYYLVPLVGYYATCAIVSPLG